MEILLHSQYNFPQEILYKNEWLGQFTPSHTYQLYREVLRTNKNSFVKVPLKELFFDSFQTKFPDCWGRKVGNIFFV